MERKRKLKLKKLLAILLVFAMITPLIGNAVDSMFTVETYAAEENKTVYPDVVFSPVAGSEYGDIKITIPSQDDGSVVKYDLTLRLDRFAADDEFHSLSAPEQYYITSINSQGVQSTNLIATTGHAWGAGEYWGKWSQSLILNNVTSGSVVYVSNVLISNGTAFKKTTANIEILEANGGDSGLTLSEVNPLTLVKDKAATAGFIKYSPIVKDTFVSNGGEYSLSYLLSHFNVISQEQIEATHIFGPIIAGDTAYRSRDVKAAGVNILNKATYLDIYSYSDDKLFASDLSKGECSFVRNLYTIKKLPGQAAFNINNDTDASMGFEKSKYLYTGTNHAISTNDNKEYVTHLFNSNEKVENGGLIGNDKNEGTAEFVSPFESGKYHGLKQNDTYIDFTELYNAVNTGSNKLINDGTLLKGKREVIVIDFNNPESYTKYYDSNSKTLKLDAGKSYTIENAYTPEENGTQEKIIEIAIIDFKYEGDFFDTPIAEETIINFEDKKINPIKLSDGNTYSRFPNIKLKGSDLPTEDGLNGEYGELGNKIIYNMPNIQTIENDNRFVPYYSASQNIPGHILIPNAELWSYDLSDISKWAGGNINGTVICKSFHSGNIESHMWAYEGTEQKSTEAHVTAKKLLDGVTTPQEFEFKLTPYIGDYKENKLDVDNVLFATSDEDGNIIFPTLFFSGAGKFYYLLEEIVPEDKGNIIYDESKYLVTINVTGTGTNLVANVTYAKKTDALIGENVDVIFNNTTSDQGDFVLPETGGTGNSLYIVSGISIMIYASFRIFKKDEIL